MRRKLLAGGLVLALMSISSLVTVALAGHNPGHTKDTGKKLRLVKVVRQTDQSQSTTSTTFTNLSGASTAFKVPAGQQALVVVTFSGSSSCSSGAAGDACKIRVMVGNKVANPRGLTIFDSVGTASNDVNEYHSVQKSIDVGPGMRPVQVQWAVSSGSTFGLRGWHMTVEVFNK